MVSILSWYRLLNIELWEEDKELMELVGWLEYRLRGYKNPTLKIIVQDEVEHGFLEEPGFHLEVFPKGKGPEERERYEVYLSKERWKQLITTGNFCSRAIIDRVNINYFEPGMPIDFS